MPWAEWVDSSQHRPSSLIPYHIDSCLLSRDVRGSQFKRLERLKASRIRIMIKPAAGGVLNPLNSLWFFDAYPIGFWVTTGMIADETSTVFSRGCKAKSQAIAADPTTAVPAIPMRVIEWYAPLLTHIKHRRYLPPLQPPQSLPHTATANFSILPLRAGHPRVAQQGSTSYRTFQSSAALLGRLTSTSKTSCRIQMF